MPSRIGQRQIYLSPLLWRALGAWQGPDKQLLMPMRLITNTRERVNPFKYSTPWIKENSWRVGQVFHKLTLASFLQAMAVCLLGAVIFATSLHRGYAVNVSINESLIHTGPQSGWCPTECSCILTYHVDCTHVERDVLRAGMLPANSSKIRSLWLDYTNLTELEGTVLKKMKYLKRLSLSNNYLTRLNPHLFSDLSSLKYLDLRNNCLVSPLNNDLFKSLGQLRTLKLDYNKLTRFDHRILTPFSNNITEITLSNNPFVCDCSIRDAVDWFKKRRLSSAATCGYPRAGEPWNTVNFVGHCESVPEPSIDLTCHTAFILVQAETEKPSDSFPLLPVLVTAISGFLVLLCGGLSLYCWRRATRSSTPNLDRRINEDKIYDDVRSNDDYYYESVHALPRYMSFVTSIRPGSPPEIPKRPQIKGIELQSSCQTTKNDYVGNVRNFVSDRDSYTQPENPTADKETAADMLLVSEDTLAPSEAPDRSGDIRTATEDGTLVSTKHLQNFRFQVNEIYEEKEVAISPLPSAAMTPSSAVRYDRPDNIEFWHVQTKEPEYPWNRQSFWRSWRNGSADFTVCTEHKSDSCLVGEVNEDEPVCAICNLSCFRSSCRNLTTKLRWILANHLRRFEFYYFCEFQNAVYIRRNSSTCEKNYQGNFENRHLL